MEDNEVNSDNWSLDRELFREILLASGVNGVLLSRFIAQVMGRYITLNDQLGIPEGHTHGSDIKLTDSVNDLMIAPDIARYLGIEAPVESMFYALLVLSLDLGRLYQAAGLCEAQDHGRKSVDECKLLFQSRANMEDAVWQCFCAAVAHHGDRMPPDRDELGPAAHWLLHAARLVDKTRGFASAEAYCHDPERKVAERVANWPIQIKRDENWGTERSWIPDEQIDQFVQGIALDRTECASYEAYMLQLLAWLYDVQPPEGLRYIISQGGPQIVLDYLRNQLGGEQRNKIVTKSLSTWGEYGLT